MHLTSGAGIVYNNIMQREPKQRRCVYCFHRVPDEKVVCPHCGRRVDRGVEKIYARKPLVLAAAVVMSVMCAFMLYAIVVLIDSNLAVSYMLAADGYRATLEGSWLYFLEEAGLTFRAIKSVLLAAVLAQCIVFLASAAMTYNAYVCYFKRKHVIMPFKICTLIIVSRIAGILLLIDKDVSVKDGAPAQAEKNAEAAGSATENGEN